MRVILMSDIHGNLPALEAVAANLPDSDRVIVAGDFCLDGPAPAEVVDLLLDLGWDLLMGNTDRDVVTSPPEAKGTKRDLIDWTRSQLGESRVRHLAELPFSRTVSLGHRQLALVVHANPLNLDEHLDPTLSAEQLQPYLEGMTAPLLAFGHLHTPYVRPVGGILLVDVSSVGHPKDLDRRAGYTVVEWDGEVRSVNQVRVPYDVERTVDLMRRSGMPRAEKEIASLLKASY